MSLEQGARRRATLSLSSAPSGARIVEGDLDGALEAWIARREATAHAAGVALGEKRSRDSAAQALDAACTRLDAAREKAAGEVSQLAVQLAVEIARELLRCEIAADRYDLERIVRDTLALSNVGRGSCVVHLNPSDAAALANVRFRNGTAIEADADVARSEVHVTTPQGVLVREIDGALQEIGERLRRVAV